MHREAVCCLQAKLLEHNVRFGDPECQCLMMRLESDLLEVLLNACEHQLHATQLQWSAQAALTVVLAAKGYPGDYAKGTVIEGLDDIQGAKVRSRNVVAPVWRCQKAYVAAFAAFLGTLTGMLNEACASCDPGLLLQRAQVFHAGTKLGRGGQLLADGGRVLSITALGNSIREAHDAAYKVHMPQSAGHEQKALPCATMGPDAVRLC